MSSVEFTDSSWAGHPVARKIAEAHPRDRVIVTGTVLEARTVPLGPSAAYECVLDDGTGRLTLVFVGRQSVPGITDGTRCTVEGTVRMAKGHLELWNPRYRLENSS